MRLHCPKLPRQGYAAISSIVCVHLVSLFNIFTEQQEFVAAIYKADSVLMTATK